MPALKHQEEQQSAQRSILGLPYGCQAEKLASHTWLAPPMDWRSPQIDWKSPPRLTKQAPQPLIHRLVGKQKDRAIANCPPATNSAASPRSKTPPHYASAYFGRARKDVEWFVHPHKAVHPLYG